MCRYLDKEIPTYLEEFIAIVHEKQQQLFTLASSQFMTLDNCSLKRLADQGPVISLQRNTPDSQQGSKIELILLNKGTLTDFEQFLSISFNNHVILIITQQKVHRKLESKVSYLFLKTASVWVSYFSHKSQ